MIHIACVGDNCVDLYRQTGEAYPGGNPVNVAVYTARLGGSAAYIGAVGTDAWGGFLLNALKAKGVDVSRVQVREGATALTEVTIENGERVFGDYDEGVMADFALSDEALDFLCGHDMVVSGIWGKVEGRLREIAARGIPVAFDCSDRPDDPIVCTALKHTTIAFFSDDISADGVLKTRMEAVAAQGPRIVVATRGKMGSLAFDGERFYEYGIIDCPVVDTMGAGDSYIAGFLYARLSGADIPGCMETGARSSAVTLGYSGAW